VDVTDGSQSDRWGMCCSPRGVSQDNSYRLQHQNKQDHVGVNHMSPAA